MSRAQDSTVLYAFFGNFAFPDRKTGMQGASGRDSAQALVPSGKSFEINYCIFRFILVFRPILWLLLHNRGSRTQKNPGNLISGAVKSLSVALTS